MSRGLGRVQRAVLAYARSEPGGRSDVDGTPLATSVTGLARVVYGVEQPSDAQRAAVRRAVRRLEAGGHVEVHRLRVGRTYTQQWLCAFQRMSFVGEFGCQLEAGAPPSVDEFEQHLGGGQGALGVLRSLRPQV